MLIVVIIQFITNHNNMMGFNHIAGGVAFTGIFSSFNNVNIFEEPEYLFCTIFFSMLPDVDHTKSIIGKVFYPFARWLDRRHGHRTITHSLLVLVCLFVVIYSLESFFFNSSVVTQISILAYSSHIIFDMCTKAGVPLFYPFTTVRCVLPANPSMRLKSGDFRSEVIIFFVFIGLNFLSLDLMANGFWSSYNKVFSTFEHLHRERINSVQPIKATFQNKQSKDKVEGVVIETESSKALIFNKGFQELTGDRYEIEEIEVSKLVFQEKEVLFFNISFDSLSRLLSLPIRELDLRSSSDFYFMKEGIQEKGTRAKFQNKLSVTVEPIEQNRQEVKLKLLELNSKIEESLKDFKREKALQLQLKNELKKLNQDFEELSLYEQGKAIDRRKELEKEIEKITIEVPDNSIIELQKEALQQELLKEQNFSGKVVFLVFPRNN